ncbi:uncharacterized protein LOC129596313 [Paramacrobiotus metropolitanus]|uniref:uncharacterized protein LOC129596313 n=1 Tax=Paramacrobiotus metropolitanus TaxID=2943436 RepID=UPI002445AF66|nr:uncharacterized protein LOC129596313 [Paramacrobiotus metropolitanus]
MRKGHKSTIGRFRKSFRYALNKDPEWAHQEIMTEAIVVLWFAAQLAVKFGSRIFAEWQGCRTDPAIPTYLDGFLEWFGLKMTGCVWNDIVSSWKPPNGIKVTTPLHHIAAAAGTVGSLGYIGAFATVCTTALLTISVVCSLFVNRHWQYPRWRQHLHGCHKITELFGYYSDGDGGYGGICHDKLRDLLLAVVVLLVQLAGATVAWFFLCALPVVMAMGAVVAGVINIFGLTAVFPCCVIVVCLMAVYCLGRLWGLWMKNTYFMWLHRKIKTAFGVDMLITVKIPDAAPAKYSPSPKLTSTERNPEPSKNFLIQKAVLFMAGATAILTNMGPLFWRFPLVQYALDANAITGSGTAASNWTYWVKGNWTVCKSNGYLYGTNLGAEMGMLSYWVDLASDELKSSNTYNAPIILSFNPDYPSIVSGIFMVWSGLVLAAGLTPYLLLALAEASCLLYIVWQIIVECRGVKESRITQTQSIHPACLWQPIANFPAEEAGTDAVYDQYVNQEAPTDTIIPCEFSDRCPSSQPTFCVCSTWAYAVYYIAVMVLAWVGWIFVPFPVLVFGLPERLQLPGILLFFTGFAVYTYRQFTPFAAEIYRMFSRDSGAPNRSAWD